MRINKAEQSAPDIGVAPEHLEVKIFADDIALKINSVQKIEEYAGGQNPAIGYLVQVDMPKRQADKPYIVLRVEAVNQEFDEKGENIYFYEVDHYATSPDGS